MRTIKRWYYRLRVKLGLPVPVTVSFQNGVKFQIRKFHPCTIADQIPNTPYQEPGQT